MTVTIALTAGEVTVRVFDHDRGKFAVVEFGDVMRWTPNGFGAEVADELIGIARRFVDAAIEVYPSVGQRVNDAQIRLIGTTD